MSNRLQRIMSLLPTSSQSSHDVPSSSTTALLNCNSVQENKIEPKGSQESSTLKRRHKSAGDGVPSCSWTEFPKRNTTQDKTSESEESQKSLNMKKQQTGDADDNNIWHRYVSLEKNNSTKDFEFETSYSYHVHQYDLSKFTDKNMQYDRGEEMEISSPSLLCHENFESSMPVEDLLEDSDDSIKDKDYVPERNDASSSSTCPSVHNDADDVPTLTHNKVKAKRNKTSASTKLNDRKKKNMAKNPMKEPCHNLCKKMCSLAFTEKERQDMHSFYWSLDREQQGIYIKNLVEPEECGKVSKKEPKKKRSVTYRYKFSKGDTKVEVCKTFFLCTLGFDKKNDRRVLDVLKKPVTEQKDKRDGRNLKIRQVDKQLLTDHVNSFNPCVHHYRRLHAPNRKYLPSDLSITDMYKNFIETHTDVKISWETYRNHVTNVMNISFAKLGHEECETCETFNLHNPAHVKNGCDPSCETCSSYLKHKARYVKARKLYDTDAKKKCTSNEIYASVDLQKVIMLPRMDTFKCTIFCPRLVAYNETFVPLGQFTNANPVLAVVWHDAVAGRKQEDIVSTFRAYMLSKRDADCITLWLDNCSAQNKNWCILTFLVDIINSHDIATTNIILRYFEPGHTFMSADSFHHLVEKNMHKKGKIYDFKDFVEAVAGAKTGKVQVKAMEVSDFLDFKAHVSQKKMKDSEGNRVYLKDIVEVMVKRGQSCLFYKTDYDETNYKTLNCMKSKNIPPAIRRSIPKGIESKRKQNLLKQLSALMPENRLSFWQDLPVSNDDSDEMVAFDLDG